MQSNELAHRTHPCRFEILRKSCNCDVCGCRCSSTLSNKLMSSFSFCLMRSLILLIDSVFFTVRFIKASMVDMSLKTRKADQILNIFAFSISLLLWSLVSLVKVAFSKKVVLHFTIIEFLSLTRSFLVSLLLFLLVAPLLCEITLLFLSFLSFLD